MLLPLTGFLLLLATSATTASSQSDLESDCTNRWIHIRRLPPKFNRDLLLNCSEYPLFVDFCSYISNHGLGQKTHNSTHSWYRTDPFMLELIFHRRMLEYPCLTPDPNLANAIFVPYYGGIDSLKYLFGPEVNSSFRHGLDLYHYLADADTPSIWGKNFGHDHFMVLARPAWDFSQPVTNDPPIFGTSFLELPEFFNITALTLEARAYPYQEQAIPYPSSFHPANLGFLESWVNRVRKSRRSALMLFAGGGGISANPNVRRSIRLECDKVANLSASGTGYGKFCDFVDCSNGICEHDPIKYMKPMLQASFCLQPPGDNPTRRSTFDAILAGCIPVFFEELSAKKQYGWHLEPDKYDEFSVSIPKEDVVFKGLKIMDVLMGIPRAEVRRKREKILEIMPRIIYRKHGGSLGLRSKKDAFDVAVEGALHRIKTRLEEIAEGGKYMREYALKITWCLGRVKMSSKWAKGKGSCCVMLVNQIRRSLTSVVLFHLRQGSPIRLASVFFLPSYVHFNLNWQIPAAPNKDKNKLSTARKLMHGANWHKAAPRRSCLTG